MNDRINDIFFIILFVLILSVFTSWSTDREQVLPMETGAYSGEDGARRAVSALRGLLTPGKSSSETPDDFTRRLRDGVSVHVDARQVIRLAGKAEEKESPAEKRRLGAVLSDLGIAIESSRYRIGTAKKEKLRSPGEISDAEKALEEMIRGAALLSERIQSTGKNPLP